MPYTAVRMSISPPLKDGDNGTPSCTQPGGNTSPSGDETPLGTYPGDGIVCPHIPANTSQKCLAGEGITTAPPQTEGGAPLGTYPGDRLS